MLDDKISKTVEDILDESGIKKWREEYWERIDEQINTKQENWAHEREYRISLVPLFDDTYDTKEKRRLRYNFDDMNVLSLNFRILYNFVVENFVPQINTLRSL